MRGQGPSDDRYHWGLSMNEDDESREGVVLLKFDAWRLGDVSES